VWNNKKGEWEKVGNNLKDIDEVFEDDNDI
jgi:hypothetical protein